MSWADLQLQLGVLLLQHRHHQVGQDVLGGGDQVQAADAAEVRLDEAQRILPHRADEIDHGVEPAEDRVVLAVARAPAVPQPLLLLRREPQQVADGEVLHGTISGSRFRAFWMVSET